MPGMNQRGPMNQGPMTGRGQGVCQSRQGGGVGFGGGRGRRACRGAGQGFGPGFGYAAAQGAPIQADLEYRARMLEQELAAVKEQLKSMGDTKE